MSISIAKGFARKSLEIPLIILSVLMSFVLLFYFLNFVFPLGSSLVFISGDEVSSRGGLVRNEQSLEVAYDGRKESLYSDATIAARITSIKRNVKSKAANRISWSNARSGLALYSRDAVQTFDNSRAVIQFDEENYIDLGENALVIIKKIEADPILREKVTRLIVFSGELSGKISSSKRNRMRMEINSPGAMARVISSNSEIPALIKFKVNADKTSTISVLEGEAIVTSNQEKKIVKRDEVITLSNQGDSGLLTPPNKVRLITPRKDALFRFKDLPPTVKFSWKKQEDVDAYELVVARDKKFTDVLSKSTMDVSYVENKTFRQGVYYWHVRGIRGFLNGPYSATRIFRIVEDNEAPDLFVNLPPDSYGKRQFTITGTSEPGTVIFINNEPVTIKSNGKFSHVIKFRKGSNTIVIESIDKVGNVTYKSKIVNVVGVR